MGTNLLREKASRLDCEFPLMKTKVQACRDILGGTVASIAMTAENVESTHTFTYLGILITRLPAANWKFFDDWDEPAAGRICWTKVCGAADTWQKDGRPRSVPVRHEH